jgi:CRP/FNR family transcriptional regulator, cyclic AMP receptor protein
MQTQTFKAGDTIIAEGEEGKTAFLVVSGSVEVIIGEGSKSRVLATLGAGEVFGEMCLIEPGPRSATVKAAADTECVVTTYDEFVGSVQQDPAQAVQFMRTLVRRLRQMNEQMAKLSPRKRGLRALFEDWQKSLQIPEGEVVPMHWTMLL